MWDSIQFAEGVIRAQYGDKVSVASGRSVFQKFGHHPALGTGVETITTLPVAHETLLASNLITTVSSSDGADTEPFTLHGYTISGSVLTSVTQTVTLDGQNQVTLPTPLARVERGFNATAAGTELLGVVYVYEDDTSTSGVPDTDALVHMVTEAGEQQSEKASMSVGGNEYMILTQAIGLIQKKSAATVDLDIQVRRPGNVFRKIAGMVVTSDGSSSSSYTFSPPFVIPPNSDVRVVGAASVVNVEVSAQLHGYMALKQD